MTKSDILKKLDSFHIELPSWGFADTGTRFGKFFQAAAATTLEEKLHDAGLVNALTGCCPTVAVHALWDLPKSTNPASVARLARRNGLRIGSINPNIFQDQAYKLGSLCSPDEKARQMAIAHVIDCVKLAGPVGSKVVSVWLADGTNYPGQDSFTRRKHALHDALKQVHSALPKGMTLLVEYKPFEPFFYHTDIADWGMSYVFCKHAGPKAKVLVDTGHHLPGTNIEHIVSFLLDEGMLGGFHFNDRKYADDDLTMGSIDPYAAFRIFAAIAQHEFDTGKPAKLEYMVDQSHNLKPKLEAMVQTVDQAQRLFVKAQLVDRKALARAQAKGDIVGAEMCLRNAYETDVTGILKQWRKAKGVPADPLAELRASGIIKALGQARSQKRSNADSSYA